MEKSLDLCSRSGSQLKKSSRGRRLREDRISSLSDDILLLIMSLLPLKEMVKTSLLSRRWLNLWVHTPVLHFHALVPKDPQRRIKKREHRNYVKWVNHVLRRHKGQYLKEFKIVYYLDGHDGKDIDSWLVFALAKKVQCLELNLLFDELDAIDLDYKINYVFPGPFLKSLFLQSDLNCLKSLSLTNVDVTGEAINFVLRNCSFLERLEVVNSSKLVNLAISYPTLVLKYLKIKYCHYDAVLSISKFNLVSLDISSVGDLTLRRLPMLVEFFIEGHSDRLSHSISQASSCFSQLEAFTLTGSSLKDATQLSNYGQLTKLKRLVITILGRDDDLTELFSIVNACPRLEEFVFECSSPVFDRMSIPISDVKQRGSSSLKSQSLKVFEFMGYCGRVIDVELIMHVVENAVGLEKVIIHSLFPCNKGEMARRNAVGLEKVVIHSIFLCNKVAMARRIASQHFDSLREAIPPHVRLLIR